MELYKKARYLKHSQCINGKRTKLYQLWLNMHQRTTNSKSPVFKHYGGRGISICSEWNDSQSFLRWALESGYKEGLEIDRINNDGNYEPSNCRWVTRQQNTLNKRKREDYGINYDHGSYYVQITRNNKIYRVKSTKDINEARRLRNELVNKLDNGTDI
jgi:hypothetical protein